jgi:hypothetical protein
MCVHVCVCNLHPLQYARHARSKPRWAHNWNRFARRWYTPQCLCLLHSSPHFFLSSIVFNNEAVVVVVMVVVMVVVVVVVVVFAMVVMVYHKCPSSVTRGLQECCKSVNRV